MKRFSVFCFLMGMSLAVCSAALTVSNRDALPDEWGYRPGEDERVKLNPPSLCWIAEPQAATYVVEVSTSEDFADALRVSNVVWNTYTHFEPFKPGKYFWRYRFVAKSGELSGWSKIRSFVVTEDATVFPMPTKDQRRKTIPVTHPRLFMRPEDLPELRKLAKGKFAEEFNRLRSQADKIIAAGPTPEPEHLGSARDKDNAELVKYWWPNREQTLRACQEGEIIAFVYLITNDKKYGEAARKWMMHLMSWDPDGPTNFGLNCEAAKPMLHRPARIYDWAWDMFSDDDRQKIHAMMKRRIKDAWESGEVGRGIGHLNKPYNSHGNRTWHKIAESAIAFLDEIPEAELWLDYALNKFYACYPVWCDDDGGWHEGLSYWAGYMSKAVWWLQFSQSALKIDGLKKPFFAQVGDFALYIAPPGSPNMGFGDLSHSRPSSGWGGFMEYFIRAGSVTVASKSAPYWRWWTEQWGMKGESGILGFLYNANLPPLPDSKPPTDIPQSKVFHGIGVASLHVTLTNSLNDVHFLFKSSPLGSRSHGHNPQNSFLLNAYGEDLLTTCVYRDLHGSRFHFNWAHSTVAHNAVLVNGEGQIKHTPVGGRIVGEKLTPEYDFVAGEAAKVYGGRLERFVRNVVFVKPDVIVIYDDIVAKEPSTYQFMLHAHQPFVIDERENMLVLERKHAAVIAKYIYGGKLEFRQWDGYDPKPTRPFPNQWHAQAGTVEKTKQIGMITILFPYKTGNKPKFTAERIESENSIGAKVNLNGENILVAFKKGDARGKASIGDDVFEEPVFVKRTK